MSPVPSDSDTFDPFGGEWQGGSDARPFPPELAEEVTRLDKQSLLASLAALQCMPENADCWFRLNCLVALALTTEGGTKPVTRSNLDRLVNKLVPADWIRLEDPPEGLFVTPVVGPLGNTAIVGGPTANPSSQLQLMLQAAFHQTEAYPATFNAAAQELSRYMLSISERLCEIAGLGRYVAAEHAPHRNVTVPAKERLETLRQAVTVRGPFGQRALTVLREVPGLVRGMANGEEVATLTGPYEAVRTVSERPILELTEGEFLVLQPSGLGTAHVAHLLRSAAAHDCTTELLFNYHQASHGLVSRIMGQWGWKSEQFAEPQHSDDLGAWVSVGVWQLEPTIHLRTFTISPSHGPITEPLLLEPKVLDAVAPETKVRQVLDLIVYQPLGIDYTLAVALSEPAPPLLWITPDDLSAIHCAEYREPLALVKLERAMSDFRRHTKVMSWNSLDDYAFYRQHGHGFYLSDTDRIGFLTIQAGMAAPLRAEIAARWDLHAAQTPDESHSVEVFRMQQGPSGALYVSMAVRGYLVETYSVPIWTLFPERSAAEALAPFGLFDLPYIIGEGLAYWLHELSPALASVFAPFARLFRSIQIDLVLEPDAKWDEVFDVGAPTEATPSVTEDESSGRVAVMLTPTLIRGLQSSSQDPERALVRKLLQGIRGLIPERHRGVLSDPRIDSVLEPHFSLPEKRMMLVIDPAARSELWPTECPDARYIQDADCELILNEIGEHLESMPGVPTHELHGEEASNLLNAAVLYLYGQLAELLSSLTGEQALPYVLARHEALLLKQARSRFHAAPRIACYGPEEKNDIIADWNQCSSADVAYRFLVEHLVAQPPAGNRPMDLVVLDRCLALSHEIIRLGMDSDVAREEVYDIGVQMLPSGRLGLSQGEFNEQRRDFLNRMLAGDLGELPRTFHEYWGGRKQPVDPPTEILETDEALMAEFGMTLLEVANCMSALYSQSIEDRLAVCHQEETECVAWLSQELGWPAEKVSSLLAHFMLAPRDSFFSPAAPAGRHDVYPWRFNRRLSYLRRAILRVPTQSGFDLYWTPRHLHRSGAYFVSLVRSSRLAGIAKQESRPFSNYKSRRNNARGRETEAAVSRQFEGSNRYKVVGPIQSVKGVRVGKAGEIDRIVFDREKKVAYVCECKNLFFAKTPREIADQLRDIVGQGQKWGAIPQALRKGTWTREQLSNLLETNRIEGNAGDWQVKEVVVVNHELLMMSVREFSVPVTSVDGLRKLFEGN